MKYKIKFDPLRECNLHWPRAGIKGTIGSGEFQVVCVLQKICPEAPALLSGLETDALKVELVCKATASKVKASEPKGKEAGVRFDEKVNNITTEQEVQTGDAQGAYFGDYDGGNAFEK